MLDRSISISVDFEPVGLYYKNKIPENEILFFCMGIFLSYLITTDSALKSVEVLIAVRCLRL
jgi:hypothetical protein